MAGKAPPHPQALSRQRPTVVLAFEWNYNALDRAVVDAARRRGWHLLDLRHFQMELPRTVPPDGVLFCLPTTRIPLLKKLLALGVPTVQIDDQIPRDGWPCVLKGGTAGGRMAAEHFLTRGFENLAYLRSGGRQWGSEQIRLECESFLAHATRAGATAKVISVQHIKNPTPWHQSDTLTKRFRKAISGLELPLGIFTYHDVMGVRICHYCQALGLSVPEQVAVLGSGNRVLNCDCASVPLSSLDPDVFGQGAAACELLDRMMGGQPAPKRPVMIPPKAVVTRQSTDVLAVPDLDVARALRYIWAHYDKGLTVPGVADAVGIGRRRLERSFRTLLHRTVNQEVTRKRIERCCELLASTTMPVSDIAEELGGLSESYLFRLFKKATGMTPRQYRLAEGSRLAHVEP